ncbi:MAG: tRNA 2-thiouridine(34) synthase MnmA [Patescibacteria group bacterium]
MKKSAPTKKKVFVGLSGGVDSSVSAAFLVRAGYDVTGVFIKVWQPDFVPCAWKEDRLDAMRVCAHLGIPFITLDLEKEYRKEVVDYMIAEYKRGNTPNPDVMCNKEVKFGAFLKYAKSQGADYVATGHYARVRELKTKNLKQKKFELLAGLDKDKDQSYFLWTLSQNQLKHILFPVGALKKREVRILAKKFGLLTATKKDSQGLCFVGKIDMKEFLGHFIAEKPGEVLNENAEVIGVHQGAGLYTLGQRRGFTITKKGKNEEVYYVISKDMKRNRIVVSDKPEKPGRNRLIVRARKLNFVSDTPKSGKKYTVRFRYRQKLQPCNVVSVDKNNLMLGLEKSDFTISPGQSLVLYDGAMVVGGGIIESQIDEK